jgi:multidrug efflux pump subunit AcrA (membrane-fusion protein)
MKQDDNECLSPEQLADHLHVTYVPAYLLAAAIGLLLAAFIVWGVLGTVSDKAYYSGVVFPAQGTTDMTLPNKGIVRTMLVQNGDSVHPGQTIAMVTVGDSHSFLTSTVSGLVISAKADNEPFEAFDPIISVVDDGAGREGTGAQGREGAKTQLIAYADNDAQRQLRIGMEAQVWPANEKRDEIGYVRGRIAQVVRYPAKVSKVRQELKSDILARRLTDEGQNLVYEVRIDLLRSPNDTTQYDWSFGQPDDVDMGVGTYCSVLTETRRRSMFQYLFEASRTRFRDLQLRFE